jgi:AP2-associated kinase
MVQVEDHQVRVEKYLSEGGYAHVYLTTSEKAISPPKKGNKWEKGFTQHCLKRIAFEDDSVWTDVKKEIEVMVSLPLLSYHLRVLAWKYELISIESITAKSTPGTIPRIKPYADVERWS